MVLIHNIMKRIKIIPMPDDTTTNNTYMIKDLKSSFYMLCSNLQVQVLPSSTVLNNNGNDNGNSNEAAQKKKAMCVGVYCCDPNYERNGTATQVHTATLQLNTPYIIIMRTVN